MRRVKTYNLNTVPGLLRRIRAKPQPSRPQRQTSMKLQPDKSSVPLVRACDSRSIQIDQWQFDGSVIVSSLQGQAPQRWAPRHVGEWQAQHLAALANAGAELVILGTGPRLVFPPPAWLAPFAQQRVGLETMDTAAACRTYNVLASEGRKVIAALLLDPAQVA